MADMLLLGIAKFPTMVSASPKHVSASVLGFGDDSNGEGCRVVRSLFGPWR
jgi:hypothetical protein